MTFQESRKTGLLRLRHLREQHEAHGEAMQPQRERFQRLAREDSAPRVVSAFNLFQTPEPLADRVAEILGERERILEPSAGLGRLYRATRKINPAAEIVMIDSAPDCCGELYRMTETDQNSRLIQGDFLQIRPERTGGLFDGILMNPPFKMGTDVTHIRHALTLLSPGGRLVSLCAAGPKQRSAFQTVANEWIDLPAGSFKESHTNVAAAIVVFDR